MDHFLFFILALWMQETQAGVGSHYHWWQGAMAQPLLWRRMVVRRLQLDAEADKQGYGDARGDWPDSNAGLPRKTTNRAFGCLQCQEEGTMVRNAPQMPQEVEVI